MKSESELKNIMETQTTRLGFRDITNRLLKKIREVEKYDIVREVLIEREIKPKPRNQGKGPIFYFYERCYNLRGIIFPNDEILSVGNRYDIIIQKAINDYSINSLINVHANPYHDFLRGEILKVKISRLSKYGSPSFKLYNNITGFFDLRYRDDSYYKTKMGDIVITEVTNLTESKDSQRIHVLVKPLREIKS